MEQLDLDEIVARAPVHTPSAHPSASLLYWSICSWYGRPWWGGGLGRRPLLVNGNHSNSQRAALLLGMSCLVLCLAAALWTDAPEAPRLVVTLLCSITRALIFTRVAQVWDVRDHPLVVPPLANSQLFSRSPSNKSCQQSILPPCTRYTNKKDASRCTWSEGTTGFGCLGRGAGGGATGATSSTLYARRLDRE